VEEVTMKEYEEGRESFFAGVYYRDNPYPDNSDEAENWSDGWLDAQDSKDRG
jgi:hypothetical protein